MMSNDAFESPTTIYAWWDKPCAHFRAIVTVKNHVDKPIYHPHDRVVNGILIENLALTQTLTQTDTQSDTQTDQIFYAYHYHNVIVDAKMAAAIADGFEELHKRVSKLCEQRGSPESFSEAVRYFAHAMGTVEIKIWGRTGWVTHSLPAGFSALDSFEKDSRKKHAKEFSG